MLLTDSLNQQNHKQEMNSRNDKHTKKQGHLNKHFQQRCGKERTNSVERERERIVSNKQNEGIKFNHELLKNQDKKKKMHRC